MKRNKIFAQALTFSPQESLPAETEVLDNRGKGALQLYSAARPYILGRAAVYLSAGGLIYASGR